MSVYTPVPVHEPPNYEQRTLTLPSRNLSQPEHAVTPLRYLGSGNPPPAPPPLLPPPPPPAPPPVPPPSQAAAIKTVPLPVETPPAVAASVPPPAVAAAASPSPSPAPVAPPPVAVETPAPTDNPVDAVFFPVSDNRVAEHYIWTLQHLTPDRCYLVVGHSDPTGPKRLILGLSLERAASVATVMRTAGLRVDVSGVGSYGTSFQIADYPKDRRADVWGHPCPGDPAPANPPPPPLPDVGGISVQVTQGQNGQWQTTLTRQFKSEAAARAWAIQMQKQPPMRADLELPNGADARLGYVATIADGYKGMAAQLDATFGVSDKVAELETALNDSAAALTASARQWLEPSPAVSLGNWRDAFASIGMPIGTPPGAMFKVTVSSPTWSQTP